MSIIADVHYNPVTVKAGKDFLQTLGKLISFCNLFGLDHKDAKVKITFPSESGVMVIEYEWQGTVLEYVDAYPDLWNRFSPNALATMTCWECRRIG